MATTAANAPATFGLLQTPSFPQRPSYMTDGLVKNEFDPADDHSALLPSSPLNVALPEPFPSDSLQQQEDITPAPVPPQSSVNDIMGDLRRDSETTSMYHPDMDLYSEAMSTHMAESVKADLESYAAEEPAAVDPQPMQAYAKLQFDDGDFYVNTYAVELGRDQDAMKRERRHKKRAKRRKAMEEEEARRGAQLGEETPSQAAAARLRDIRGIAGSNVSESGGIIGVSVYSDSEEEHRHLRRRRRRGLTSQDSSHSQSIAPANVLHNPESLGLGEDLFTSDTQALIPTTIDIPFVPIYRNSDDVKGNGISRKHVRIEYNSEKAHWELHALGRNGAFIDGTLIRPGETAKLQHNAHIQIQQISIVFKLPDVAIMDEEVAVESCEFDSDAEKPGVSHMNAKDDSESLSELEEEDIPRERVKLKLSLSKRGQALDQKNAKSAKISLKTVKEKEKPRTVSPSVEPVEEAPIPEMEVRPSIEQVASETPDPKAKSEPAGVPAVPAANLAPGSVLEGLAPEEIPQKRKGPGRPPKNGVMSKRDEAIIKRKRKELLKAGMQLPSLTEMLAMARAESGTTTKKANDEDGDGSGPNGTPGEGAAGAGEGSSKPQTAAEIEAAKARKAAAKSPSPQKPESDYTEEELKKPQKTYVVLIHDALTNSPTGIMDLQQIYDAIQKMYPYYKYRSQTTGWQSSIRHNLIGSNAFEEAGKIGKGRLWKINPGFDIGKEKKRRAPTPPTSDNKPPYPYQYQQQQQHGQYPNGNNNQQQRYPPYGPSPYGTPYGPPTNALPNGAKPPPSYAQQRNGTYYSPYAAQPQNGQAQQSPYGVQGRPPYTHGPNQPPNGQSAAAGTPQPGNQQRPTGPPQQGHQGHQSTPPAGAPPQPGQARPPQQQEGIGNNDTIEEIMAYHKRYLGQFRPGPEQDAARDLFRKAVSRHIDQNKVHGAYISDEEKKVADVIGEIITRNKNKPRPAGPPVPQSQQQSSAPQGQTLPQQGHPVPGPGPAHAQHGAPHAARPGSHPPQQHTASHPVQATHSPAPAAQMGGQPPAPPLSGVPVQVSAPQMSAAPRPGASQGAPAMIDLTGGPNEQPRPVPVVQLPAAAPAPAAPTATMSAPPQQPAPPPPPPAVSTTVPASGPIAPSSVAPEAASTGQKRSADDAGVEGPEAKRTKN